MVFKSVSEPDVVDDVVACNPRAWQAGELSIVGGHSAQHSQTLTQNNREDGKIAQWVTVLVDNLC